jgi:hypothetical protein
MGFIFVRRSAVKTHESRTRRWSRSVRKVSKLQSQIQALSTTDNLVLDAHMLSSILGADHTQGLFAWLEANLAGKF